MTAAGERIGDKIRESSRELPITLSLSWAKALPQH